MSEIEEAEVKKLIRDNPHLKKYLDEISKKTQKPAFYSKVPRDLKDQEFPNVIYTTKGSVFIHILKTKDMEKPEYHAIEPLIGEELKPKRDFIIESMYERAHFKTNIKSQEDLRKAIRDVINQITAIDEKASTKIGKSKGGKIKVTSTEKTMIEYDIIKEIVGGGPLEPFMRDPYIEDIHIITGENVHLIHKVSDMVKTNIFIDKTWANRFSQELQKKSAVL